MTHIRDYVLCKKYGGGSSDWDKLEEIINDFEVNDCAVDNMVDDCEHINNMISDCFLDVIWRLKKEFEKLDDDNTDWFSTFTNCMDSHLYINKVEVHTYEEAKEQAEKYLKQLK